MAGDAQLLGLQGPNLGCHCPRGQSCSCSTAEPLFVLVPLCRILLPSCTGSHPFYTYTHTAWMVAGLLLYYQWGALVRYISGSQLAVWYYRLLGARIGSNVLLNGLHR